MIANLIQGTDFWFVFCLRIWYIGYFTFTFLHSDFFLMISFFVWLFQVVVLTMFTLITLFSTIIPISLYVSIEVTSIAWECAFHLHVICKWSRNIFCGNVGDQISTVYSVHQQWFKYVSCWNEYTSIG